jgi:hypothetical protein
MFLDMLNDAPMVMYLFLSLIHDNIDGKIIVLSSWTCSIPLLVGVSIEEPQVSKKGNIQFMKKGSYFLFL